MSRSKELSVTANNLKDFSIAATKYIIDLEEAYGLCAGKIDALNDWYKLQTEAEKAQ